MRSIYVSESTHKVSRSNNNLEALKTFRPRGITRTQNPGANRVKRKANNVVSRASIHSAGPILIFGGAQFFLLVKYQDYFVGLCLRRKLFIGQFHLLTVCRLNY